MIIFCYYNALEIYYLIGLSSTRLLMAVCPLRPIAGCEDASHSSGRGDSLPFLSN
jgi:hypothetical protein